MPVGGRPEPQPARPRHRVDAGHGHHHPGQPAVTGRQVWNRQRTDRDLADPADVSLGHKDVPRWNLPDGWVISKRPAHPALVSEADFVAAQDVSAARGPAPRTRGGVGIPERRQTAYVREDRRSCRTSARPAPALCTAPSGGTRRRRTRRGTDVRHQAAEDVIAYLRERQITLAYDPAEGTLRADTGDTAQIITLKAS